jgi:molecular chaperone HtpG
MPVTDTDPVWKRRDPNKSEDEKELKAFYKKFFDDILDPVFSLRFESVDIGLSGVVFFRNTKNGTEEIDGTFKVYNRGVFVGENIQTLIPKFVNLQSGIIDCRELPLVVSRSDVRESGGNDAGSGEASIIELIYETLIHEVTIAMNDLFTNGRARYEALWPELNAFIKYAALQDKVFASVMTRKVVFADLNGDYYTIAEYREKYGEAGQDAVTPFTVYYVTDPVEQAHYIEIFKRSGLNALLFDHVIDQPFLRIQELVHPNTQFVRIDSDTESLFCGETTDGDAPVIAALKEKFQHALGPRIDNLKLNITNLNAAQINVLIIHDEKSRRMADMLEMYGMMKGTDQAAREIQSGSTLLVNMKNDIIRYAADADDDMSDLIISQLFDLALLSQGALNIDDVEAFILRNETLLGMIANKS